MAVTHTDKKRFNPTLLLVALALLAVAAGTWQYLQSPTKGGVSASKIDTSPPAISAASPTTAPPSEPQAEITAPAIEKLMAEQKEVAQEVAKQPQIKHISGGIKEKPTFLTLFEWNVIQSVAMRQPNPDKSLTDLVNKMRFTKQMEAWQDLPPSADINQRRLLANELLEDLPQRITNDDYDLAAARKLMQALMSDVEPNANKRAAAAKQQLKRLEKAQAALDAAASAVNR